MNLVLLNKLENLYNNGGISKFKYVEYKINHDAIESELSRLKIEKEISAGVINQDLNTETPLLSLSLDHLEFLVQLQISTIS